MSCRPLLRTTSNFISRATTRHSPQYALPSIFSLPCPPQATLPSVRIRFVSRISSRNIERYGKALRRPVEPDEERRRCPRIDKETFALLGEIGIEESQATNLQRVIFHRHMMRRNLRYIYDSLCNRELWSRDASLVPAPYRDNWDRDRKLDYCNEDDIARIGQYSDEVMGTACDYLGLFSLVNGERDNHVDILESGCLFLQLGVLYGNATAATHLLNYHKDPVRAELLAGYDLESGIKDAMALVREMATEHTATTDALVMVTYMGDEFGQQKIRVQRPDQLEWGLRRLDRLDTPELDILKNEDWYPFYKYQHPAQIKLQIIDHCLKAKITLPTIPRRELSDRRESALLELVAANDPFASMVLAVRGDGPETYSKDWQRLLTIAAESGNGHALWLLGVHHMRQEGILPVTSETKTKLENSLGLEFACLSILALRDNAQRFVAYTLALAAVCRAAGDNARGLKILADSIREADTDDFPRDAWNTLDGNYEDWLSKNPNRKGYWDEEKTGGLMALCDPHHPEVQKILKIYR